MKHRMHVLNTVLCCHCQAMMLSLKISRLQLILCRNKFIYINSFWGLCSGRFLEKIKLVEWLWIWRKVADYVFLDGKYVDGSNPDAWATQSTNEAITFLPWTSRSCLVAQGSKFQFGHYLRYDLGWSCVQPGFLSTLDSYTSNVLCQKPPVQPVGEFLKIVYKKIKSFSCYR